MAQTFGACRGKARVLQLILTVSLTALDVDVADTSEVHETPA
jgi:hypothetical protein